MEEDLDPSILGTKEYWDNLYNTEINNFHQYGDIGEIWFGVSSERRIVKWLYEHPTVVSKNAKILDLGCGNGSLLLSLKRKGFINLMGVDYSPQAIQLAKGICVEQNAPDISFQELDIIKVDVELNDRFDVILDKGTFDAISLMENASESKLAYKRNLLKMFDCQSQYKTFIIASCNWTKDELCQFFSSKMTFVEEMESPSLQFGGKVGKNVTTVVFKLA